MKKPDGQPCQFLTVCQLTKKEKEWLQYTDGNFVTQSLLDKNEWSVPKNFINTSSEELNNSSTSLDKNENLGFTQANSFESDVMGITP